MLFTSVAWFIFFTLWALLAVRGFCPKAVVRGRELRKGSMPWCFCSIHLCSVLVVKHLAQPDELLGMGVVR